MFETIRRETMRQLCRPWEETRVGMRIDSTKTVHAMQRVFLSFGRIEGALFKEDLAEQGWCPRPDGEHLYAMLENQSY